MEGEAPDEEPVQRSRAMSMGGHVQMYKREPSKRVFVNRSLMLDRVKYFGFDMDYTLAMYKSPEYETLGFNLLKVKLVEMGYPAEIGEFEYDPTFPIRGLWFDCHFGTLLKVDGSGNILMCVRGFHFMRASEIEAIYPTKFVQMDEARFRIFNTLYDLPLIYILACLIDYFNNSSSYTKSPHGVKHGDITMTYQSMYNDVDSCMEMVHRKGGPLKTETTKDLEKYVIKDERLPTLLTRLRASGKKVFLATNSGYRFSNAVMTYLFDTESNTDKREWVSFFDFIVVDSKKPLFFAQGTVLREVNRETERLHLGTFTGNIRCGAIYSGGSVDVFNNMMGTTAADREVVYVGDHIFGDILKSKKVRGWRTFLVVPELGQELSVWTEQNHLFARIGSLDYEIAEIYRNLDSSCTSKPDITGIQKAIRSATHEVDQAYGVLGSLFRSGTRQTFYATQVMRYADLYAASFMNLMYYPLSYAFRAPPMHMPHESTVDHESKLTEEQFKKIGMAWRSRTLSDKQKKNPAAGASASTTPRHLFCDAPNKLTEVCDEFLETDEEEEA